MKNNWKAAIGALAAIASLTAPVLANADGIDTGSGETHSQVHVQDTLQPIPCVAPFSAPATDGHAGWRKSDTFEGCTLTVKAEGTNNAMPNAVSNEVQHVTFAGPSKTVFSDTTSLNLSSKPNLVTFTSASLVDSSQLTDMAFLFMGDTALQRIDLAGFNTSNVTNMNSMFASDIALQYLNISNFSTTSVTDMGNMFYGNVSMRDLDLRMFITLGVTNMQNMFYGDHLLNQLNLSSFDTSSVKNMQGMFAGLNSGNNTPMDLNLSTFDTENVENMDSMFANANVSNIEGLSAFRTGKVKYMHNMFATSPLTTLDLTTWDMTKTEISPGSPLPPGQAAPTPITLPANLTQLTVSLTTRLGSDSFPVAATGFTWTQVTSPYVSFDHDASYTTSQLIDHVNAASTDVKGTYLRQIKRVALLDNEAPEDGYSSTTAPSTAPNPLVALGYNADANLPDGDGGTAYVANREMKVTLPGNTITYSNGGHETKDFTFVGWKDAVANRIYPAGDTVTLTADSVTLKANWNRNRDSRSLNDEYIVDSGITNDHYYTNATWNAFQTALNAAGNVLADGSKGQTNVDTTLANLCDARSKLDKSPLQILVDQAGRLTQNDYTSDSWNSLQHALTAAKNVLDNHNSTQDEISAAVRNLTQAMKSLVRQNHNGHDKTVLSDTIKEAENKKRTGNKDGRYDETAWRNFLGALDLAEDTQNDSNTTQDIIDNAWQHLIDTIAGLEPTPSGSDSGITSDSEHSNTEGKKEENSSHNGKDDTVKNAKDKGNGSSADSDKKSDGSSNGNNQDSPSSLQRRQVPSPSGKKQSTNVDESNDFNGAILNARSNDTQPSLHGSQNGNQNSDAHHRQRDKTTAGARSASSRHPAAWSWMIGLVLIITIACLIAGYLYTCKRKNNATSSDE
ncbi:BspA family leucine-rich repeat surface protein [Bifidobacterium sp. ESL0732]|uniref:BspA family leucine-rich repeat surface protein n=1 Tax=Bifidobacterium sp. ESL0732 TaxID=2983222 RepID=UPI0023F806AC|nr:BspA family leucine-rich repeat surface protein [Bifidobacterium sp. ESL0732]WEV64035.1 BspA family leucine-rich repeat surface protein [Bifidobacterium sp. ESL0732]